ncbi:hypothetical protein ADK57_42610 [Streptomyces sp. MMG1533]|uniref:sigma-70 family RNA polymerase sigma factor n=1 Tax=Streptomyces sp. MMG1533 TaxID=1415546 RepID=UPI0006AD91EF|nr:sigma-70 family RNA polymerase sigma factor [Streptomyces sp. MMG1533]KOU56331.1 hypothetical protein ADK57_42610 [Streptomyces sp. MMG1533]
MNDGATATYARLYEEQQPRLVAYARSLTKNAWAAEDLVAEAHFRVWRRLSAGHEIDNVPAYLMTTVRHLATAAGSAVRETPRDPQVPEQVERGTHRDDPADPAEQVSSVDLLVRVLGQLPERWVKALWLAEAEGQPLAAVGSQIGSNQGATAVLLHRAREGMRQAFLQVQTGAPDDPACQVHWARMPAYVRGSATSRQSERLLGHVDACDDCRGRLAVLVHANNRLPALVGPALLVFVLGGAGKFLLPFAAGSAGAAVTAGGQGGGLLHGVRDAVTGGSKVPAAVGAGATVTGLAVAILISLGALDPSSVPVPSEKVPVAEAPVAKVPVAQPPQGPAAEATEDRGTSAGTADGVGSTRGTSVLLRAADEPTGGTGNAENAESAPSGAQQGAEQGEGEERETAGGGAPETELPQAEAPDGEAPEAETPVAVVPPAAEVPETETPQTEAPEPETPVTETPVTETPVTETPVTETPAAETPEPETPATEAPETETPHTEAPEPETPVTETPVTETPAPEAPVTETPEPETPVVPLPETTPEPDPVTPTPVDPAPVEETPVPQPTPSDPGGDCG